MKKMLKSFVALSLMGAIFTPSVLANESSDINTNYFGLAQEDSRTELQTAVDEAVAAFEQEFPDVGIEEIDVELENGQGYDIDIDGKTEDKEYQITYNSKDKAITEREEEDETNQLDDLLDLIKAISIDEATDIAKGEAQLETPTNWTLDFDTERNVMVWEVEFDDDQNDQEAEVKIDATNGEVLKVDTDA